MTKRSSISRRGVPVEVQTTDTAEWDIADYRISDTQLEIIGRALVSVPVSRRDDVVDGSIRYRQFGEIVAVFPFSGGRDAFVVNICGLRPVERLDASDIVLKALEKIATLRGAAGV